MSFKVRLLLGAAVPLAFAAPAFAQVTISTATTTPVSTSTVDNGNPANVIVSSTGSITMATQPGATALTIDSDNTLANSGAITLTDSNNATGVRIQANRTSSISNSGGISLTEDYTRTDTDSDGDLDGPVAVGTGRTGILLEAGGTMTGHIGLSGGTITVEGNDSAGVSLRSTLDGSYVQKNGIVVTGANTFGVDIRENVTGNVQIGGTTSTNGENATAIRVLGDVGGEFMIDGSVFTTGFTSTTISNYADPDQLGPGSTPIADRRDADDLLDTGRAVEIRGDLAFGFLINGNAVGGVDPTDDVKDVIQDFNENRTMGTVSSLGSGPAVLIKPLDGAAGNELRLSLARETVLDTLDDDNDNNVSEVIATFNYDYGFVNRGTVSGNGFNIGFAPIGVRIAGSDDSTHQTIVDGGVFNGGSINTQGYEANAISLNIGAGATTPRIVNQGAINATVNTETTHSATALQIDAGANVPAVLNTGFIAANVRGYDGDAVAFRDLSGTVTSFTNNSRMVAGYIDDDATDDITSGLGRAIAADLSHSTSNVTFLQTDTVGNTRVFGDVLFGVGDDRFNIYSGEVRGDVEFGAGADTLDIRNSLLVGDTTFGGSSANVMLDNARILGDLSLGAAGGSLSVVNNSVYNGAVTRTGAGPMTLSVNNATFNTFSNGALPLDSLSFTSGSKVGFLIDNTRVTNNAPVFNVSGAANIAADTVFTPIFGQFTNQAFTIRLVEAGTVNAGGSIEAMLNGDSPYLFDLSLAQATGEQAIDLSLRVKTATELGLNTREAGAYDAVLDLLEQDDTVAAAITSLATEGEFLRGWGDMMPASDAAVVRVLASNASAAFGAAAHRLDLISQKPDAPEGAWVEEFGVYYDSDTTGAARGVAGGGFGVAAGLDLFATNTSILGAFASLESVELDEKLRTSAPLNVTQTSVGAYGGWRSGALAVNGAAAFGFSEFRSSRDLETTGLTDTFHGAWDATSWMASARASYTLAAGPIDIKPYVSFDHITVSQEDYTETAGSLDALALVAGEAESSLSTAGVGFAVSGSFGNDDTLRLNPEISVGYRSVLNWDTTPAALRFGGGSAGSSFTLDPGDDPDDAIVAGIGLNLTSQFLNIKLGYDAQVTDTDTTHYGSLTLRLAFW